MHRAGIEARLLGRELHREGEAGGVAALLAVGLRQMLEYFDAGKCHV